MEQKLVRFCQTSDFSFPNFVRVGLDSDVNLSDWNRSLEKHSPLISAPALLEKCQSCHSRLL